MKIKLIEVFRAENFDRVNPVTWVFWFSLLGILIGANFIFLGVLAWVSGLVLFIFVCVFAYTIWDKTK